MSLVSNIINKEETKKLIRETLEDLSTTLSMSLGPNGSTTIIQDQFAMNQVITKDGYTILNKLKYDNQVSSTVLDIVKKISRKLVREVGDGSTSAIIISNALYHCLDAFIEKYPQVPTKDILDVLQIYEDYLTNEIKEYATPITEENFSVIKDIASIANNNDDKAGDLVYDVYKKIGANGFISLETSSTDADDTVISNGMLFYRGNINTIFATEPDKVSCVFDKPKIFMCNDSLTYDDLMLLQAILGLVCCTQANPLVVIAKGYDPEVRNFFQINKMHNKQLLFVPVDYALIDQDHFNSFQDLAVYLGCEIYDKANGLTINPEDIEKSTNKIESMFGGALKVSITDSETHFTQGSGEEKIIAERVDLIKEEANKILQGKGKYVDVGADIFVCNKRIADLTCKTATIYVGGKSEIEKETRKFLMEDAVLACKSALKNGYIMGGNLIIPTIIFNNWDTFVNKISDQINIPNINKQIFIDDFNRVIVKSFAESFANVLKNQNSVSDIEKIEAIITNCTSNYSLYNLKTREYESISDTSIINSVCTDIEIMKACFSIIGLLVTSNQFISVQTNR